MASPSTRATTGGERLFAVKGRDAASAIALIAADAAMAEQVAAEGFGPLERRLASAFWPGPLTIVVPAASGMSAALRRAGRLACACRRISSRARCPRHSARASPRRAPIRRAGAPSVTADEVAATLGELVDFLVDAGPAPGGAPSTVVELVEGRPLLHRAGAVAWDRVLEFVE